MKTIRMHVSSCMLFRDRSSVACKKELELVKISRSMLSCSWAPQRPTALVELGFWGRGWEAPKTVRDENENQTHAVTVSLLHFWSVARSEEPTIHQTDMLSGQTRTWAAPGDTLQWGQPVWLKLWSGGQCWDWEGSTSTQKLMKTKFEDPCFDRSGPLGSQSVDF